MDIILIIIFFICLYSITNIIMERFIVHDKVLCKKEFKKRAVIFTTMLIIGTLSVVGIGRIHIARQKAEKERKEFIKDNYTIFEKTTNNEERIFVVLDENKTVVKNAFCEIVETMAKEEMTWEFVEDTGLRMYFIVYVPMDNTKYTEIERSK